ncbi:hypothetical protein SANTM175S_08419 [Streptomyces antimycoticus]
MDTLTTPAVESLYDDLFLNGGFTIMARTDGSAYVPTDGYAVSLTRRSTPFPPPLRSTHSRT